MLSDWLSVHAKAWLLGRETYNEGLLACELIGAYFEKKARTNMVKSQPLLRSPLQVMGRGLLTNQYNPSYAFKQTYYGQHKPLVQDLSISLLQVQPLRFKRWIILKLLAATTSWWVLTKQALCEPPYALPHSLYLTQFANTAISSVRRLRLQSEQPGTAGQPQMKEWIWAPISHRTQKLTQNGSKT